MPQTTELIAVELSTGGKAKPAGFYVEQHQVLDGAARVVRTRTGGEYWQLVYYIPGEGRAWRKSLRTKELALAKAKARSEVIAIESRRANGDAIFTCSFDEAVEKFVEQKQGEADANFITRGRVTTIKSILKAAKKYIRGTRKIDSISGSEWEGYPAWRRVNIPEIKDVTLNNEKSVISSFYLYCEKLRLTSSRNKPEFRKSSKYRSETQERRSAFDTEEWRQVTNSMRKRAPVGTDQADITRRKLVRYFILLSANTGLRFGEMRNLRWSDVKAYDLTSTEGSAQRVCKINVRAETSKTRTYREVQGQRGDIIDKLRQLSPPIKPSDYVFNDPSTGELVSRKFMYNYWKQIMSDCGLAERRDLTFYSLRHTYATFRLLSGVDIYSLSLNMGCKIAYIEQHYGHVTTADKARLLTGKSALGLV